MSALPDSFRALVAEKQDDDVARGIQDLRADDLPDGDIVVRVDWSSVNYKDALAVSPKGRVAQISPLVPGVDLAGTVVERRGRRLRGDRARARSRDRPPRRVRRVRARAGRVGRPAARRPAARARRWRSAPRASPPDCRCSGSRSTAWSPATGRCSCSAPPAGSARPRSASSPRAGSRSSPQPASPTRPTGCASSAPPRCCRARRPRRSPKKPMESERWAAVVDPVGGDALAYALRTTQYGGAVAASGLTGGTSLETTVFPFILRGVSLLGVDSVNTPDDVRRERVGAPGRRPAPERPRRVDHPRDRPRRPRPVPRRRAGGKGVGRTVVKVS